MNLAIIPARGGSKGIPRKNIKLLGGKPLIAYSILAAQDSGKFDRVIVSTEDQEISEIASGFGAEVRNRPAKLAADDVHSVHAVLDCVDNFHLNDSDLVCMLLPTSPFRSSADVASAMDIAMKNVCEPVISVVKCDHIATCFRTIVDGRLHPIIPITDCNAQRQKSELFEVNGSIYVASSLYLKTNRSFHKHPAIPYAMPKSRSLDINDGWDWKLAELIIEGLK